MLLIWRGLCLQARSNSSLDRRITQLASRWIGAEQNPIRCHNISSQPWATLSIPNDGVWLILYGTFNDLGRSDPDGNLQLVDRVLVPHIDFRTSANLVLGPHWKDASEQQREAFIDEFRAFLVRFYAGALANYVDTAQVPADVISFTEDPRSKSARQVFVRSLVGRPGSDSVPVEYRMYWRDSWKVIDVSIDGISIVQNYRSNFSSTVKREGLDVLIAQLHERNLSFAAN